MEGSSLNKKTRRWYKDQNQQKPGKINGQENTRTWFYRKELKKICKSIFKIECPEEWDKDYMLERLINNGYFIITQSAIGPIPYWGSLTGRNYLNFPTGAIMTAPTLGDWTCTFDVDGVLMYLEHDYLRWFYKLQELIQITAQRLASADGAIDVNIFNSKLAYVAEAETKAQAETIKELYDKVSEGNPLVVYRKDALTNQKNGLQVFFNNIKQNYVSDMLQDTKRSIMNDFLTAIGVNNANTDKRERLLTNEVDANNIELDANTIHWEENLEKQSKKVKEVFPEITFKIELRYSEINRRAIEQAFKSVEGNNDPTERNRNMGNATSQ